MSAVWTEEETRALVGVWGAEGVQSQLDGVTRNKAIFQKIASALADLGYTRTWQQCKTFINPRRACAARVTVVVLCLSVCLYVCLSEHAILTVRAVRSITKDAIVLSVRFAAILKRRFS